MRTLLITLGLMAAAACGSAPTKTSNPTTPAPGTVANPNGTANPNTVANPNGATNPNSPAAPANCTATTQMTIDNFTIAPACILLTRGANGTATLTVTNNDSAPHDIASQAGSANTFDTGPLNASGGTATVSLTVAGSSQAYCTYHTSMAPVTVFVQ